MFKLKLNMEQNNVNNGLTILIDQDYINSEGQINPNSLTNKGNESHCFNKSKAISLGPPEEMEEDTREKGKKMASKKSNLCHKNNNTKKEKKELPSSKLNKQKSLSSLSKKQVFQDGHIQLGRKDNEIKNEKNVHENEEIDLDKIGNSELLNARNVGYNKEIKNPKNSIEVLNNQKSQANFSTTDITNNFALSKELEKLYKSSFWNYLQKTLTCFIINVITYFNHIAESFYGLEKSYFPIREYDITKDNYLEILEGYIKDFIFLENDKNKFNELLEMEKKYKRHKIELLEFIAFTKSKIMFLNYLKNRRFAIHNDTEFYLTRKFKTLEDDLIIYDEELNNRLIKLISSSPMASNLQLIIEINKEEESYKCFKPNYTSRRKIMLKCLESTHTEIEEICDKYQVELHKVTLKPQIGHSFKDYRIFSKKILKSIYCEFQPRNTEKNKNYTYESKAIDIAIKKEKNKNKGDRTLYKLYNWARYIDFLKVFFFCQDENCQIKIKDEDGHIYKIKLQSFITYRAYFNEFSDEEKKNFEYYRRDLIEIMNGIKKDRNFSEERAKTWAKKKTILGKKTNFNNFINA